MHKDEQFFNLYMSLQQLVPHVPLCLALRPSDGGNIQQRVICVGRVLPAGKWAPWQHIFHLPTQLSLNYTANANVQNASPDYGT